MKLRLSFPISTSDVDTLESIERVASPPPSIDEPSTRAVLFLRAASGRASICLSAFYLFLGAESTTADQRKEWTYKQKVKHYTLRFSAIGTIALSARAIFDSTSKDGLNAKMVTKLSSKDSEKVFSYWSNNDPSKVHDAQLALSFVQKVLTRCAIPINEAKRSECILTRRVALMKAYADREVAHISLHPYEYRLLDVAHVAAATALFGAVIHHFDGRADGGLEYLQGIDEAAHEAAMEIFPELKDIPRLFAGEKAETIFRTLYKNKLIDGADYLSTWLLSALGWDNIPRNFWNQMQADNTS